MLEGSREVERVGELAEHVFDLVRRYAHATQHACRLGFRRQNRHALHVLAPFDSVPSVIETPGLYEQRPRSGARRDNGLASQKPFGSTLSGDESLVVVIGGSGLIGSKLVA